MQAFMFWEALSLPLKFTTCLHQNRKLIGLSFLTSTLISQVSSTLIYQIWHNCVEFWLETLWMKYYKTIEEGYEKSITNVVALFVWINISCLDPIWLLNGHFGNKFFRWWTLYPMRLWFIMPTQKSKSSSDRWWY